MRNNNLSVLIILLIIGALFLGITPQVSGHGSGQSIEKKVGKYTVDIGYNAQTITSGDPVRFDFRLLEEGKTVPFDNVWVRLSDGPFTAFAGSIGVPPLGKAGMTYVFPKEGQYKLSVRYSQGEESLVEASSTLNVQPSQNSEGGGTSLPKLIVIGIVGAIAGFGASYFTKS